MPYKAHIYSKRITLPCLLMVLVFCFSLKVSGETHHGDSMIYKIETRASFAGGENTPFWLVSNLYGLGDPKFNNGYVRASLEKPLNPTKKFSWGAKADLTGAWNLPAPFRIQQLYAELKYRRIYVFLGAKEFESPYNRRGLSSGDLLFSGNALPIPQLRIGTYDFAPFWGTKGWFSVKAYLAYGMFTDSRWQKHWVSDQNYASGVLFCSRGLWLRGGNMEKFPLTFDVGIEMATQFGGKIHSSEGVLKMPSGIKDWIKAVIPFAGNEDTPEGEQVNVQGNMNGEYTIAVAYHPTKDWKIRAYWEHYFEDHSQMTFEYGAWKDGLWGLEIEFPKNKFVSRFLFEYVSTYDQTGPILNDSSPMVPEQISGNDDYYNHYLYGAWQNWGMVIGTPFAISPLYNKDHRMVLYDNRFKAQHFALEGNPMKNLSWRMLLSFTRNWGTYRRPLPEIMNNFSGLIEVAYQFPFLKGGFAKGAIAWDKGKLLGNNFGGMISVGYQGDFSLRK